jgi:hypothetical protein
MVSQHVGINYDLGVMRRFNRLWEVLEETLTDDEMRHVRSVLEDTRGISYRRLETLVFHPSQDIGDITARHATRLGAKSLSSLLLAVSTRLRAQFESDLLSFILFDGDFAQELISGVTTCAREPTRSSRSSRHEWGRRAGRVFNFELWVALREADAEPNEREEWVRQPVHPAQVANPWTRREQ